MRWNWQFSGSQEFFLLFHGIVILVLVCGDLAVTYRFCPVKYRFVYQSICHCNDDQEKQGMKDQSKILISAARDEQGDRIEYY